MLASGPDPQPVRPDIVDTAQQTGAGHLEPSEKSKGKRRVDEASDAPESVAQEDSTCREQTRDIEEEDQDDPFPPRSAKRKRRRLVQSSADEEEVATSQPGKTLRSKSGGRSSDHGSRRKSSRTYRPRPGCYRELSDKEIGDPAVDEEDSSSDDDDDNDDGDPCRVCHMLWDGTEPMVECDL